MDQDVLITGLDPYYRVITKLYTNHGMGNYAEVSSNIFGVYYGSLAFADVDNDLDQDVLITGYNKSYQSIAKLYANNGSGTYTLVTGTPFDTIGYSSIAFADVDNDMDQDVLIIGYNRSNQSIAKLYANNGSGTYTLVTGTPFDGVSNSSIAFADIDNDNDLDVLITGNNNSNQTTAKLYTNNGTGSFTLVNGTPFDGAGSSSIAFADVDNDNDQDVLITGRNSLNQVIAKLYTNNGTGNYTLVPGTPFEGVESGSIAFADVDNDMDQDVLITGQNYNGKPIANLYRNLLLSHCQEFIDTSTISVCNNYRWRGMNLTTSGTYYDTIPNATSCDSIMTLNLTINETSASFYANVCNSYHWQGMTFLTSGTYYDTILNAATCDSLMTLNLTINTIDTSVTKQSNILISNQTNATYQWFDCTNQTILSNETNDSLVVSNNGTFAVIISKNGCTDTSECINVTGVGVVENSPEGKIKIFPNPSRGIVTIDLSRTQGPMQLEVRDITGRLVDTKTHLRNQLINYQINGPEGIYFFTVSDLNNNRKFFKIIKQ